jgi:hypothetical protein
MMEWRHESGALHVRTRKYFHMALRQFDCGTTAHAAERSPNPLNVVGLLIYTTVPTSTGPAGH